MVINNKITINKGLSLTNVCIYFFKVKPLTNYIMEDNLPTIKRRLKFPSASVALQL
jgi:hypothetical protein